jgi:hypothetical protein
MGLMILSDEGCFTLISSSQLYTVQKLAKVRMSKSWNKMIYIYELGIQENIYTNETFASYY